MKFVEPTLTIESSRALGGSMATRWTPALRLEATTPAVTSVVRASTRVHPLCATVLNHCADRCFGPEFGECSLTTSTTMSTPYSAAAVSTPRSTWVQSECTSLSHTTATTGSTWIARGAV